MKLVDVDRESLARAIARLPEVERLIVTLVDFEGVALDAAAEVLQLDLDEAAELYKRAVGRLAESLNLREAGLRPASLRDWTDARATREAGRSHARYKSGLEEQYTQYFERHKQRRGDHRWLARNLALALPDGWESLQELLPVRARHRWHLSGGSSQVVALGLLGSALRREPSLDWLRRALAPLPSLGQLIQAPQFEHELGETVLNESRRPTTIDFYVEGTESVVCIEAKWWENGIGQCSCRRDGGDPEKGDCRRPPELRPAYWRVAQEFFGLPGLASPSPCSISFAYQAIRNAAAAVALAGPSRHAVFGLIYDENNPYFRRTGDWPGWPTILAETLQDSDERLAFRAISWQDLLGVLPLDAEVLAWAYEKHALRGRDHG